MNRRQILSFTIIAMFTFALCGCGKNEDAQSRDRSGRVRPDTVNSAKEVKPVELDFNYSIESFDDATTRIVITASDIDGNVRWTYEGERVPVTELDVVQDIGETSYGYLFLSGGTVYCLDKYNADEASVRWSNSEYGGAGACYDFDDDENLLLCGYYGPHFMAIDRDGNTLMRTDRVDDSEECDWPCQFEWQGGNVQITFESDYVVLYDYNNGVVIDSWHNDSTYDDVAFDYSCADGYTYEDDNINIGNLIDIGFETDYAIYDYKLPYIQVPETDYINYINTSVENIYYDNIAYALNDIKEYEYSDILGTSYKVYCYDDIYSLVINIHGDYDMSDYYVFNFDADGNEVTNADIFAAYGITDDEFVRQAIAVEEEICDYEDEWSYMLDATIAEDNLNAQMPVYIDDDGVLHYVIGEHVPAGAGYYNVIRNL